ncbi:uncharacterized protein BO72DRAFT_487175 [Aspergillus fijiensis CBS 313.89]|uniref:Uncharacterized protein n=1 Tax=Aspergillus fijiensis CBS 313.89 TaxID=1448319 RepID=A0A8G1VWU5_9EURO|nr:uncharacterized protein BO72DRAFT_487175 [Aspergillus fijiensis CBS 313.89]RAK75945.1 hypothetical protein BO72DRAFT_487175 [Aspergillus fijiensis CBS 313.89]
MATLQTESAQKEFASQCQATNLDYGLPDWDSDTSSDSDNETVSSVNIVGPDEVSLAKIPYWLDQTPGLKAKDRKPVPPPRVYFPVDAPDSPELHRRMSYLLGTNRIKATVAGEMAASYAGVPINVQNSEWAIPEPLLDQAAEILRADGFPACPACPRTAAWSEMLGQSDSEEEGEESDKASSEGKRRSLRQKKVRCAVLRRDKPSHRAYPRPAYHFHTDHRYPKSAWDLEQSRGVFLYPMKAVIHPALPDPPCGPAAHGDEPAFLWPLSQRSPRSAPGTSIYRTTSSSHLPAAGAGLLDFRGRQNPKHYPVNMLTPVKAVENLVRLIMRHRGQWVNHYWIRLFTAYMLFAFDVNHLDGDQSLSGRVKLEMEGVGDWLELQLDDNTNIDRAFHAVWRAIKNAREPPLFYRYGTCNQHAHYQIWHRQQCRRPW